MIFITGATGFLGAHLLHDLANLDQPVRALYRDRSKMAFVKKIFQYYPDDADALMGKIEWVQGDLLDYQALTEYMRNADQIYHCAGLVSFCNADKQKMVDVNIKGTAHVVNACLELAIPRLCHVSSISALGIAYDGDLIDENRLWNQGASASHYSLTKFRGEMEVWRGIHEGLNAVIVNPSVIIGAGMWLGSVSGLYRQIYRGLKFYPAGASGYIDVRDVARIMIRLMNTNINGERFIISAENRTHREIINELARGMERPLPAYPLTPMLSGLISSLEKIRSLVTGKPQRVTLRSIRSATAIYAYTNQKIKDAIAIDFIPVKDSLAYSSGLFMEEMKSRDKGRVGSKE